ncbi:MAG: Gluconokinase [Firmicutes bacterium]|nr:Gluconokinase [Bacillota bacterium]
MNVLVLEASTTSAKAMVYSSDGEILRLEVAPFSAEVSEVTQQDTVGVYDQLIQVGRKAAAGYEIAAIGLVGIWHSLLFTRFKRPLIKALTWANTNVPVTASEYRNNPKLAEIHYRLSGCIPHASYPLYKLISLNKQRNLAATFNNKVLLSLYDPRVEIFGISDFIFYQLTGVFGTSPNMASGTSLLNVKTRQWDGLLLSRTGYRLDQLPTLYHHSQSFPLTEKAAAELGIQAGIPVTLPFADGCMNQLGANAFVPGIMTMSVGTSCAIRTIAERLPKFPVEAGLWCYQGLDNYLVGAATSGGTNCVEWFRNLFAPDMSLKALDASVDIAHKRPVFLPFIYGERAPGWQAYSRGGFFADGIFLDSDSLEDEVKRNALVARYGIPALYTSVLEGILMTVLQCFKQLTAVVYTHTINLSGGILYSPVWRQMAADILQRELAMPSSEQASTLGGARMALQAIDPVKYPIKPKIKTTPTASEGSQGMGRTTPIVNHLHLSTIRPTLVKVSEPDQVIHPDPLRREHYEQRFNTYLEAYAATHQQG